MLDESLVFHKTDLGAQEIGGAARTLASKLRRALILVDGVRSVADLAPMFREGEIDAILEELQAGGYVSLEGEAITDTASPGAPAASPDEPARIEGTKRAAMREVMERLGPDGDALALKIERAASPTELRTVLDEVERVISAILGAAAARAFAQKVGRGPGG